MSKHISMNMQLRSILIELKHLYNLLKQSEFNREVKRQAFETGEKLMAAGLCSSAEFDRVILDYSNECDSTHDLQEDYLLQEDYVQSFLTVNAEELEIPSTVHIAVCNGTVQFWRERDYSLEEKILGEY